MNFTPFPELVSNRLFLRNIFPSDHAELLYLRSDKTLNKYIERPEHRQTKTTADAIKFIKELNENIQNNTSIAWGITLKNKPQIIGTICLWNFSKNKAFAEVGFDLHSEFQGKGIMTEALKLILDFGFNTLKLHKIEAFTHRENKSSKKLLLKNGFDLITDRKDMDNVCNVIFEIKNLV
ncbi:GNAT family N-acetyltransferase [Winogradskyella schleiferi]|uniref:GNAT family N-acetyltransferase n=1 Tax=Winogradskyella schleiferi TaxID=2686078 RepID=UPI0015BCD61A|nr:GNAT family N-acetyltransferase [Winogradskyella schleiferi]